MKKHDERPELNLLSVMASDSTWEDGIPYVGKSLAQLFLGNLDPEGL